MPTMPSPSERRVQKKSDPAPAPAPEDAWAVKSDKIQEVLELGCLVFLMFS